MVTETQPGDVTEPTCPCTTLNQGGHFLEYPALGSQDASSGPSLGPRGFMANSSQATCSPQDHLVPGHLPCPAQATSSWATSSWATSSPQDHHPQPGPPPPCRITTPSPGHLPQGPPPPRRITAPSPGPPPPLRINAPSQGHLPQGLPPVEKDDPAVVAYVAVHDGPADTGQVLASSHHSGVPPVPYSSPAALGTTGSL